MIGSEKEGCYAVDVGVVAVDVFSDLWGARAGAASLSPASGRESFTRCLSLSQVDCPKSPPKP